MTKFAHYEFIYHEIMRFSFSFVPFSSRKLLRVWPSKSKVLKDKEIVDKNEH